MKPVVAMGRKVRQKKC